MEPADVDNFVRDIIEYQKKKMKVLNGFTERDKYIIRVVLKFRCSNLLFHSYYHLTISGLHRDT